MQIKKQICCSLLMFSFQYSKPPRWHEVRVLSSKGSSPPDQWQCTLRAIIPKQHISLPEFLCRFKKCNESSRIFSPRAYTSTRWHCTEFFEFTGGFPVWLGTMADDDDSSSDDEKEEPTAMAYPMMMPHLGFIQLVAVWSAFCQLRVSTISWYPPKLMVLLQGIPYVTTRF